MTSGNGLLLAAGPRATPRRNSAPMADVKPSRRGFGPGRTSGARQGVAGWSARSGPPEAQCVRAIRGRACRLGCKTPGQGLFRHASVNQTAQPTGVRLTRHASEPWSLVCRA